MTIKKKYLICIAIIIVLTISFLIFLLISKNEKKYTGSMVGIFIHSNDNYRSGVELRANGTCDIASSLDSKFNVYYLDCTYIRKDKEVILTYYTNASNKYVTISYDILPDGNLGLLNNIYYRQ